jgi:hypothetical protein
MAKREPPFRRMPEDERPKPFQSAKKKKARSATLEVTEKVKVSLKKS